MTGCDFDWMVSNHVVWGWKTPVKASVSGVSLGSITSRCSGKLARTHPPKELFSGRIKDRTRETGEIEPSVSLLQLSPFFAAIFPPFLQKRLILRLEICRRLASFEFY